MNPRRKTGLILAFGVSLGVHGAAYASLVARPPEPAAQELVSEVSFEVKPAPPELPALPPQPAPIAPATAAAKPASRAAISMPTAGPPAPRSPAAVGPLDLSGVTLTNDTGIGFSMPTGDGGALHGPIAAVGGRTAALAAPRAPLPSPSVFVPLADLSEHPRPPALGSALRANYPEQARQRGLRGAASVRARIELDGVIRSANLLSETAPGFGSACRRTVVGSRWSAPRDKNGRAVATEIVYTCHFEVDQ